MKAGQWLEGMLLGLTLLVIAKAVEETVGESLEREPWRWQELVLAGGAVVVSLVGTAVLIAVGPAGQ